MNQENGAVEEHQGKNNKTSIMDRVEKNVKIKLFDLYERKKFLKDFSTGKKVWVKEEGGLSLKEHVVKNQIEIDVLEEMFL